MRIPAFLSAAFLALALALPAAAQDVERVKSDLRKKFPEAQIDTVRKSGYGGLLEVTGGGEVFYTDEKTTFLLLGTLIDTKTRENVTEARVRKLSAVKFDTLPREGGESNPADHALAYTYARRDLAAVLRADVFWLLMPHPGNRTIGAWFEAGAFTASCVQRPRPMIVSGAAPWRTIFASLADRYFDDDHSAFGALRDEAARVAAVREVK